MGYFKHYLYRTLKKQVYEINYQVACWLLANLFAISQFLRPKMIFSYNLNNQ
jgi:hypothetical protein